MERVLFTGHVSNTCLTLTLTCPTQRSTWLMFSHASWSYEVFWCATEGYFALLMLFKEVPTPSISPTLVSKSDILLYLSFSSFYLNF